MGQANLRCKEVWSKHGAKVQAVHFVLLRMLLYFVKETTVKGPKVIILNHNVKVSY